MRFNIEDGYIYIELDLRTARFMVLLDFIIAASNVMMNGQPYQIIAPLLIG